MWFNATAFGADPLATNAQNNADAINEAINVASTSGGWATVYVPAGDYKITQLRLKSRVILRGEGYRTTFTQEVFAGDAVILDSPNVDKVVLKDFRLFGNKIPQTAPNRGIFLANNGGSGFDMGDSLHVVENVIIKECQSGGLVVDSGVRSLRAINVFASACDGPGFDILCTDSEFVACTTGASGIQGWNVAGNNNRFVTCKAFGSGQVTEAAGDGWLITGDRNQFAACEAQDNKRHGFSLFNVKDCVLSACGSDTNGVGSQQAGVGFRLDNADYCVITGNAFNRAGSPATQWYAATLANGSTNNSLVLSSRAHTTGDIEGGAGETNFIVVNGRTYLNVVPSASLPAAGTAQNGRILIEDVAANDRNLIIYAGGQRFRINPGLPF